jgi:4-amino-4-deoxy-L-arabinose transferase-like glycosyltransferase
MGADGISYLDIGDAYMRGDFYVAVNAMWSPFYSWLVGLTLKLINPTPFWEFTVVRLLNFLVYVLVLVCFSCFLRRLRREHCRRWANRALPEWTWLVFGYTIFIWTCLFMNRVSRTSPDLLVAGLVFLVCALLLQIRIEATRWRSFIVLGFVLGLAYLTKTIMFPLAFVFVAAAFILARRSIGTRHAVVRAVLSLVVFLSLALPFVILLSRVKHRFTIGDSARLNYAWYVNGTKRFTHWQGEPSGSGTPLHPTRKLLESPLIYEFGGPQGISYPPWYDPSYWYDGVTPRFNLRQQFAAIRRNLGSLYNSLLYGFFLAAFCLGLVILLYQDGGALINVREYWFLIVPALIALSLYLLINIEPRYLAPFVPVIALSLLAAVPSSGTAEGRRWLGGITCGVLLIFLLAVFPFAVRATYSSLRELVGGTAASRDVQWQVAEGLRQLGVQPGERVAVIGNTMFDSWPRLARVRVVAEIPEIPVGNPERFWFAEGNTQQQAFTALALSGARVVVADSFPRDAANRLKDEKLGCWQHLGRTEHYFCLLQ